MKDRSDSRGWSVKLLGVDGADELRDIAGRASRGEVHVGTGRLRSRAQCTCGWDGGPRLLRASAIIDAQLHATGGCELSNPLVMGDRAAVKAAARTSAPAGLVHFR